jgi:hypothetical protein
LNHADQLGAFVGGLLTGALGGSFLTLRITRQNRLGNDSTVTDQRRARAGGDIVGRDKNSVAKGD